MAWDPRTVETTLSGYFKSLHSREADLGLSQGEYILVLYELRVLLKPAGVPDIAHREGVCRLAI